MSSVDVITSALNEEECIPEFVSRVRKALSSIGNIKYRIIIMDNGSKDNTWLRICEEVEEGDIVGIQLSRTYGFDSALTCGLDQANADFVIIMTSDLQDPPEIIPELWKKINEGFDQVVVEISNRESVPFFRRLLSGTFYKLAFWITKGLLPKNVSDFRIMRRRAYLSARSLRERHRFLRGLNAWIGFETASITIDRPPRFAGRSKWLSMSIFGVIAQATTSIFAYSSRPLFWISFFSFATALLCLLASPVILLLWFLYGVPFQGFGVIVSSLLATFSIIMLCFAVLSLYVSLVYEEVKQRPLYLVKEIKVKDSAITRSRRKF